MKREKTCKRKKCPFCGGEERFATEEGNWILCPKCGAESDYFDRKEEAITAWNTRKPMKRIVERLENEKGFEVFVFSVSSRNCGNSYKIGYETGINEAIEIVKEEM